MCEDDNNDRQGDDWESSGFGRGCCVWDSGLLVLLSFSRVPGVCWVMSSPWEPHACRGSEFWGKRCECLKKILGFSMCDHHLALQEKWRVEVVGGKQRLSWCRHPKLCWHVWGWWRRWPTGDQQGGKTGSSAGLRGLQRHEQVQAGEGAFNEIHLGQLPLQVWHADGHCYICIIAPLIEARGSLLAFVSASSP